MSTSGRLTDVYREAEKIIFNPDDRFVMMSDCHRGTGSAGDDFLKNRQIYLAALRYYNRRKFTYIELGDGDELWENKEPKEICQVHRDVFALLEEFHKEKRFYMLYGNHDMQKRREDYFTMNCCGYCCEETGDQMVFMEGCSAKEGLILEECGTGRNIFLVHGHQGDLFNDYLWKINRFLVRHIWRRMELFGMENPMSTSGSGKKKSRVERHLMEWADRNRQMMIAGHTHRVKFPTDGKSYYFNDGSCVRPFSITAIELEKGVLRLVEWSVMTSEDSYMYIGRKKLGEVKFALFDKEKIR